jgi:DNA replication protein DnaC
VTAAGTPGGLAPVLRQLGLSGMLGTIDARLAEARAGTLGHAEFLQVLCEDELARRDAAKITRRISAARFPASDATLESFDFGYNPKLPAAQIRDLARLEFIAAGEGVLAYGPVGVGKSHLAAALGHQACRRGYDVAFTTCSRLLAHLAGGHADRSFEARVRKLAKTAVLIVDLSGVLSHPSVTSPAWPEDLFPHVGVSLSKVPHQRRRRRHYGRAWGCSVSCLMGSGPGR